MNATRVFLIVLAVCLSSSFFLSAESGPTVGSGDSDLETTVAGHIQKSVDHYAAGSFEQSLQSAEEALELLEKQVAIAYNNICSAQMELGALAQAAKACNKAVALMPGFQRAWGNLAWVYARQAEQTPTAGAYLNLSVAYYWQDAISRSIDASERALQLDPGSAIAHNNICAAYAKSGEWKRAIRECEIALEIDPDYQLAKNNLEWAKSQATDGPE
jgi:tetratricopeptide (TPR) repeat protein